MEISERRRELGRFLRDRRSRIKPSEIGLPERSHRRVSGLRREEVATLAGVGVTWYTMLENGTAIGVSPATLAAVAGALRLTDDEIAYVQRLAEDRAGTKPHVDVATITRDALAAIEWAPAYICTSHWIVLAWNRAMSLVWGIESPGGASFNIVARMFRDPALRAMHGERFPAFARALAAMVRSATAAHGDDPTYQQMCDDLRTDPLFANAWDAYDIVTPMGSPATEVDSAALGRFSYRALTLELPDDEGHWIVMQIPDASSAARLRAALSR